MSHASANAPRSARAGRAESVWIGTVAASLLAGCAATSMERAAPPVAAATIESAAARGFSVNDIRRGREIFLAKCAECHTLQPPAGHTEQEWRDILPRMARRARLDKDDAQRVEAYVLAARDAGAVGTPTK